jgi:hypothetical protein
MGNQRLQKENPDFERREKNEEIIARKCQPQSQLLREHARSSPITFSPYVIEI